MGGTTYKCHRKSDKAEGRRNSLIIKGDGIGIGPEGGMISAEREERSLLGQTKSHDLTVE